MKYKRMKRHLAILCVIGMLTASMLSACNKASSAEPSGSTGAKTDNDMGSEDNKSNENKVRDSENKAQAAAVDKEQEEEPAPTSIDFEWPEDFSLYKAYEEDFLLGTVYTDANMKGNDKELTLKHFNVITPENLMKPEYMQPKEGNFNYRNSDVMAQFAEDNGLKLVGHTLVWHSQSGRWLGRDVNRETAIEQLKSHITNIVNQYKGRFISWDVVNEAINDGAALPKDGDWTKCLRNTQWLSSIGPDYLEMAFQFAREADPDLKLYYNDYNLNNKNKADIVYAMVKDFKERGIPIDGIGMQGHYSSGMPVGSVEYSLKKFSGLDVEVSITELDVTVNGAAAGGLTKEQEMAQAITYAELFKLFREYRDTIERVTFWGYVDNKSWRRDRFPCLFNGDFTTKQAAYAVLDPEMFLQLNNTKEEDTEVKAVKVGYGTPIIDAEADDAWSSCDYIAVDNQIMAWEGATGKARVLWDESYIYVLMEVKDNLLNDSSFNPYEQDSVEIFLDQNNDKTGYYGDDDGQYRVNYRGISSFGSIPDQSGFKAKARITADGYIVEMAIPLVITAKEGMLMGFDAQVNDSNGNGMRQSISKFSDLTDNSYQSTEKFGNLELAR